MARAPRLTFSLSPDMLRWLRAWGQERRLTTDSEIIRAFVAAHAAGQCADVNAMAFSAGREQVLAELRQEGRALMTEVATRLRKR